MEKRTIKDIAYVINKIRNEKKLPKPIVLLGAGASVSAGIPNAEAIAKKILSDFADKPAIQRLNPEEQKDYYHLMSALSADERRTLFLNYINSESVKLNVAHIYLAQLIKEGLIDYVFTPNFDDLLLRACALFDYIPPVYDISNFKDFTTTNFQNASITYLHGQHHGQWLLNAKGELEKVKGIIPKLFNRVCDKRTWIIVGYSGNDELLDELAKFESFDNELYWIGYKNTDPIQRVRELLLNNNQKNSFLISGYNADSFFLELHAELKLKTPEIFNKPFSFIQNMLGKIKDMEDYKSDVENKEKYDAVRNRLIKSKQMVDKAIEEIENDEFNKLEQEINEATIKGEFKKADYFYREAINSNDNNVKIACSALFNDFGLRIYSEFNGENHSILSTCIEKYKIAVELDNNNYYAHNNLGNLYSRIAKLDLDVKSFEKSILEYSIATKIAPNIEITFINWGLSLIEIARLLSKSEYYLESIEKFNLAIKINPNNDISYISWGNALFFLAVEDCNQTLFQESFGKFKFATELNPSNAKGFISWSASLIKFYHISTDEKLKLELLELAFEKASKAHILNGQVYNLACVYALRREKSRALFYLNASLKNNEISKKHILEDKDWEFFLEDPAFVEIISLY